MLRLSPLRALTGFAEASSGFSSVYCAVIGRGWGTATDSLSFRPSTGHKTSYSLPWSLLLSYRWHWRRSLPEDTCLEHQGPADSNTTLWTALHLGHRYKMGHIEEGGFGFHWTQLLCGCTLTKWGCCVNPQNSSPTVFMMWSGGCLCSASCKSRKQSSSTGLGLTQPSQVALRNPQRGSQYSVLAEPWDIKSPSHRPEP